METTIARHLEGKIRPMLANFDKVSDSARIWIYQADRPINPAEKAMIREQTEAFLSQWAAHGSALQAAGDVLYDHFLVICIDESFQMASGCSIDSSVRFVQELGQRMNLDFFQRTNLAFDLETGMKLVPLSKMKTAVESGQVKADSLFFDNNIQSKGQLASQWRVKAGESWLKRYFKATLSV